MTPPAIGSRPAKKMAPGPAVRAAMQLAAGRRVGVPLRQQSGTGCVRAHTRDAASLPRSCTTSAVRIPITFASVALLTGESSTAPRRQGSHVHVRL